MQPDTPYSRLVACLEAVEARWRTAIFKLFTLKSTATVGGQEWLNQAIQECQQSQDELVRAHTTFATVLAETSGGLGLSPESTLREVAAAAQAAGAAPWDYILAEHRREILGLAARLSGLQQESIDLFRNLQDRIGATLSLLGARSQPCYGQYGEAGLPVGSIGLVDTHA